MRATILLSGRPRAAALAWLTAAMAGGMVDGTAAYAASASAQASAIVIAPVAITRTANLEFSAPRPRATSVVIQSTGGLSGNMSGASSTATESTPASFTVSGDGNTTYAVTVPSPIVVTQTGGAQTITVAAEVASKHANGLFPTSTENVLVGGTLMASLSPAQGSYAGSFSVVIEYN